MEEELKNILEGEVETSEEVLEKYSRDTSIFKVRPQVVVFPKNESDIEALVRFVTDKKKEGRNISLTARAAGSCMSGGPLNESIIMDVTRHMNGFELRSNDLEATVEPGVFYRDFEKETEKAGVVLPTYPASKDLAALGGMIANNAAGEMTLKYGKTNKYVKELDVVLADGNQYNFKPLNKNELEERKSQDNFEGEVYRKMYNLLDDNYEMIQKARPDVSKNSAGYALWDVWDRETFDMTQLFVGSQGTLGMWTSAEIKLVKEKKHKKLVTVFFKELKHMPEIVNKALPYNPEEIESFDDETLKLGLKFMPQIAKRVGESLFEFMLKFLPEVWVGLRLLGLPKVTLLVQFTEDSPKEAEEAANNFARSINTKGVVTRVVPTEHEAEKYWIVRRESFSLLRNQVSGKFSAPFIDDVVVKPEYLPEFLPAVLKILKEHDIFVTLFGHAGSGNFHIIPLMDLSKPEEREKILSVSDKVYDLVVKYKGSITAEHNDGIIRTPYLEQMYGSEVYALFKEVKNIFDPLNIFNPGKKVGGSKAYIRDHIVAKTNS